MRFPFGSLHRFFFDACAIALLAMVRKPAADVEADAHVRSARIMLRI